VLYCTFLYCTVLDCNVIYFVLYCTVLYCTALYTVCPGVEKSHFLTCKILDTRIVFLQIYHEGGSVVEKVLNRNNFKRICGLQKMVTLSFAQNNFYLYSFNFVFRTFQISLKKMFNPILESSLETETGNITRNTHFDNYHHKKGL